MRLLFAYVSCFLFGCTVICVSEDDPARFHGMETEDTRYCEICLPEQINCYPESERASRLAERRGETR